MLPVGLKRNGEAVAIAVGAAVSDYAGLGIDSAGELVFDADPPDIVINGNPIVMTTQGLSMVPYATRVGPTNFQNGAMFDANGSMVTVTVALAIPPLQAQNGFTFDANGALLIP